MVQIPAMEFRIVKTKRSLFESCKQEIPSGVYHVKDGEIYVRMNWERLLLFGSEAQIKKFDRFREAYIHQLLEKHTKPIYNCHVRVIGSKSPRSDIDINLWCNKEHIEKVLYSIYQDHRRIFPHQSFDELFDINIYSTVYHYLTPVCTEVKQMITSCYPRRLSSYEQRMWSFMRIVEVLERRSFKERNTYLSSWPCEYQTLYQTAVPLLKKTQQKYQHHDYAYYIHAYFQLLAQENPKASPHEIANAFSVASFIEKDSYRSVGAILHIVEKIPQLPKTVLYDSIYDNLGFIYHIIYHESLCVKEQTLVKLMKCSKYIYRIMDAIQHILPENHKRIPFIVQLYDLSTIITEKKKKLVPITEIEKDISSLLSLLSVSELSKTAFLSSFTQFVFHVLPKDPLLPSCS